MKNFTFYDCYHICPQQLDQPSGCQADTSPMAVCQTRPSKTVWTSKCSLLYRGIAMRAHPTHLHSHYPPETGRGSPDHGEPDDAGAVIPHRLNRTAHRLGSRTSPPVRCVFSPVPKGHELAVTGKAANCQPIWVTVWVRFFCSLKAITFYIVKHPENNRFRGVLWS